MRGSVGGGRESLGGVLVEGIVVGEVAFSREPLRGWIDGIMVEGDLGWLSVMLKVSFMLLL